MFGGTDETAIRLWNTSICAPDCVYIPKKCAESQSAFHINFCDVVDCNVLCGQSRFYIGSEWTATGTNLLNHS